MPIDSGFAGSLRGTAAEGLVRLISTNIQRGVYRPGQRLRQRELAAEFDVSTTPVREALQVLSAQGFVVSDAHRGTVVAQRTAAEIREAYEIRKALEGLAVAHAVRNITDEAIDEARSALEDMELAPGRTEWARLDDSFHFKIYTWSQMPNLVEMISGLRNVAAYYVEAAYEVEQRREEAHADHARILETCRMRDPELAREAIERHLEHSAKLAVKHAKDSQVEVEDNAVV